MLLTRVTHGADLNNIDLFDSYDCLLIVFNPLPQLNQSSPDVKPR
jgi:hypothetical protein